MAKNTVPEAKEALNRFKMEAASEVGVNLKQGYNGDLTSKQAGSVGGQMVNVMCPVRTVQFQRTNWTKQPTSADYIRILHSGINITAGRTGGLFLC